MIGARFGYVQCGPINTDSNGVGILEFTPVSNNCLGAGIDGEATHWQHRGGSIHSEYNVPVAGNAKDAPQIRFLNGRSGLTLTMGRLETSSVGRES